ncbi:MAG: hypothetical protein ACKO04_12105 [Actinomycetes bacterium]
MAATVVACSPAAPPTGPEVGSAATVEGLTFIPATWNSAYAEEAPFTDEGGLLLLRVDNPSAEPDEVVEVTVNGVPVASLAGLRWWRVWPPEMGPAGSPTASSVVTVKAAGGPLRAGQDVVVRARTLLGHEVSRTVRLRGPVVRVGSVVPTPDRTALKVFVRNRSTEPYTVDRLAVNDQTFVPGQDAAVSTPDGSWTIAPGRVLVATVQLDEPAPVMAPVALQVGAVNPAGRREWVLGALRLMDPEWNMGTWHDELAGRTDQDKMAAKGALVDQIVGGASAPFNSLWEQWRIRTNAQRFSSSTNVAAQRDNPAIRSWLLSDEPDLGNAADDTSAAVAARVDAWRLLDPTHPTWVNFAMQRRFNEYGQTPDITGLDHYVVCAPNVILGTGWARTAAMEEAIDYVDVLKDNTEPLPMWVWPQLSAGSWACQPDAWAVSTQFWGAVMAGADGINWFTWNSDRLGDPKYAVPMAQANRDVRVARQVRDVLTYGETESSSTASSPRVQTRTVVGERRQVVMACNLQYSTDGPAWLPTYGHQPVSATVSVEVPSWIHPVTVRRVGPDGTTSVPFTASGRTVSVPVTLDSECAVFLVGPADTVAPTAPTGLVRANATTLAWSEGRDDVGVAGYQVRKDGAVVGTTDQAAFSSPDVGTGVWTVASLDAAGNVGPPSAPAP